MAPSSHSQEPPGNPGRFTSEVLAGFDTRLDTPPSQTPSPISGHSSIENDHVLTLSRQYFFLRKPLERRLYELARKHCGSQPKWTIGLELLRDKCGSSSTPKEFRRLVGRIIEDDADHRHMPDYAFAIDDDLLVVRPKRPALPNGPVLASDTYEAARSLASGWDIRVLEAEWRDWVSQKRIAVKDADRHFLSFCKRRGPLR